MRTHPSLRLSLWPALVLSLALAPLASLSGCGGGGGTDAGMDAGPQEMDAGPEEDAGTDAGPPDPSAICDELGLTSVPMEAGGGAAFDTVAGDFTVNTRGGTFTLSENWSGCESYVFINYYPGIGYITDLFRTPVLPMLEVSPRNVHYFFGSYATPDWDRTAIADLMDGMQANVEATLEGMSAEDAEHWRSHIHYVTDPIQSTEGSVAAFVSGQPFVRFAFAIGRDQRWDPVGALSEIGFGGFTPTFRMAGYVPHYFNYRASLRERLAAEEAGGGVTILPIMEDEVVTERILDREVTLPDAEAMASFDTLELDVTVTCLLEPDGCSEWDRNAYIHLCTNADCSERQELVRWITPYSRPGRRRWVMDASALLGLMREGGARTLRITMGPPWEEATERTVRINARLSTQGNPRSMEVVPTFRGGNFNDTYNDTRAPLEFTPPAGTTRVEIVSIISGHGQVDGTNCAEWCNHEHTYTVNGADEHFIDFEGEAGQSYGCAELAAQGVVPGQWGNWAPLRAAWCPGYPVAARRTDITSEVTIGALNTLEYRGTFRGTTPPSGDNGNIDLSTYVVFYQ